MVKKQGLMRARNRLWCAGGTGHEHQLALQCLPGYAPEFDPVNWCGITSSALVWAGGPYGMRRAKHCATGSKNSSPMSRTNPVSADHSFEPLLLPADCSVTLNQSFPQLILIFPSLMTLPHFLISSSTKRPMSSDFIGAGSSPAFPKA